MTNSILVKAKRPDFLLCIPVVILLGIGMVMVNSSSTLVSMQLYDDPQRVFFKQLVALVLGVPILIAGILIPHDLYRRRWVIGLMAVVIGVLLVGVLFQGQAKGASRWYNIMGFGFQPSALATVVSILFVAGTTTAFQKRYDMWIQRIKMLVPFLIIYCGLILGQNDFGTTMIILVITGVMLFLAGIPYRILVLGGVLLLPILIGLIITKPHRLARIMSYLGEPHYQVVQSQIALGSGGVTGVGLGQGRQKMHYLPEGHTDFIFANLGEEFGLVGCVVLLLCYLAFLVRGCQILLRVPSEYSRLLGAGLLMLITLQAFLNISVALGLFPNKGLTLPFISAGGTSLIISMAVFGIILNISRFQLMDNRAVA